MRGYFLPSDVFYLALCQVLVRNFKDSVQSEGNCWITLRQKRYYNYPRQFIQLIDKGHCNTLQTRQWLRKYKKQTRALNWQRNILTSLFLEIYIERKNKQAFSFNICRRKVHLFFIRYIFIALSVSKSEWFLYYATISSYAWIIP